MKAFLVLFVLFGILILGKISESRRLRSRIIHPVSLRRVPIVYRTNRLIGRQRLVSSPIVSSRISSKVRLQPIRRGGKLMYVRVPVTRRGSTGVLVNAPSRRSKNTLMAPRTNTRKSASLKKNTINNHKNVRQTIILAKTANIMSSVGHQNAGSSVLVNKGRGSIQGGHPSRHPPIHHPLTPPHNHHVGMGPSSAVGQSGIPNIMAHGPQHVQPIGQFQAMAHSNTHANHANPPQAPPAGSLAPHPIMPVNPALNQIGHNIPTPINPAGNHAAGGMLGGQQSGGQGLPLDSIIAALSVVTQPTAPGHGTTGAPMGSNLMGANGANALTNLVGGNQGGANALGSNAGLAEALMLMLGEQSSAGTDPWNSLVGGGANGQQLSNLINSITAPASASDQIIINTNGNDLRISTHPNKGGMLIRDNSKPAQSSNNNLNSLGSSLALRALLAELK